MSTRYTRVIGLGLIAFVLLVCIGAVSFRDNLFRWAHDPRIPFQTYTPPPAPDYAVRQAWYSLPEENTGGVAVFYVHPTTYWGRDGWNAPIDAEKPRARLRDIYGPNALVILDGAGPVYAPFYRQASLYSALTHRFDAKRARDLARQDVERAFQRFLGGIDPTQPFILFGVEQGALHLTALLQDVAADPLLRERLVAAYLLEQAVPADLFRGALNGLLPCEAPQSLHCVVSYGAFEQGESQEITRFQRRSMVWEQSNALSPTAGRELVCVNPVFGARNEDFAPARLHAGGINAAGMDGATSPPPMAQQTSAQCQNGILLVERPQSAGLRNPLRWGGRFKPDVARLFAADLQADMARRIAAHESQRDSQGVPLAPIEDLIEIDQAPVNRVDG